MKNGHRKDVENKLLWREHNIPQNSTHTTLSFTPYGNQFGPLALVAYTVLFNFCYQDVEEPAKPQPID
ncbi:hypothetical protein ACTXT7_000669 [Hymenolepis weldensis]